MKLILGDNIKTSVEIDYNKFTNVIHVLDLDQGKTVTNAIEQLMPKIHTKLKLLGELGDYTWYLYGTDGVVSEYYVSSGRFKQLSETDPLLHKIYVNYIKERVG